MYLLEKSKSCSLEAQSTPGAGRKARANWNIFPLMLLVCSVDIPIHINRSHLLASHCASRPPSRVLCGLGLKEQETPCNKINRPKVVNINQNRDGSQWIKTPVFSHWSDLPQAYQSVCVCDTLHSASTFSKSMLMGRLQRHTLKTTCSVLR